MQLSKNTSPFNWGIQPAEGKTYYPLGQKTLFMLTFRKSGIFFASFFILCAGVVALGYVPAQYIDIAINVVLLYAAFVLLILLVVCFTGWLQYFRYGIAISDKDLKIKRGFIATEEIGVPYRRIRDVKINRSLLEQIFGVSDIMVILSDFEGSEPVSEDSTVFLPSIERGVAMEIQDNILKKSQVEQINVVSGHTIVNP